MTDVSPTRLALALWGKAQPADPGAIASHPLVCHMLDVGHVAELLLTEILPRGTAAHLLHGLGLPEDDARAWIVFVILLHDLGKATPAFQKKWEGGHAGLRELGFDLTAPPNARDHGTIGVFLVHGALRELGVDDALAGRLARAVAAHHGSFPSDADVGWRVAVREVGRAPAWRAARGALVDLLSALTKIRERPLPDAAASEGNWAFFSALAGLTSVADWVGSMAEVFVYEAPSDIEAYAHRSRERARMSLERVGFRAPLRTKPLSFSSLFGFPPRPLQEAMESLVATTPPPLAIVVEAPMGEGKTEAALFVAHALAAAGVHDGVYIGLPTQATANQMFERLAAFLERTRPDQRTNLQLLHGEAVFQTRVRQLLQAVYSPMPHGSEAATSGGLVSEHWFLSKKRALLAPFGAGTVDQALLAVLHTRHAFVRQLGLAGKTVVFDEVHAYDAYTSTILDRLLAWLGTLGASVVILSATLPSTRRRALLEAYAGRALDFGHTPAYPRVSAITRDARPVVATSIGTERASTIVSLTWLPDDPAPLRALVVEQLQVGGALGILCNTVRRAQETYAGLRALRDAGALPRDTVLLLLHARFPSEDRQRLEQRLIASIGKGAARPSRMIVVGTQVLEQSLDIDFDRLVTDLAPVDLVLQRAGRLHRHSIAARPRGAEKPALTIIAPEGDPKTVPLDDVGAVYERYVLRRSLILLRERETIALPADIEPLVEAVYVDGPGEWIDVLRADRDAFDKRRAEDAGLAKHRVWPRPQVVDDPFEDMGLALEEDDPKLSQLLRAATRLGDDSAEVVCLFGSATEAWLDAARTVRVDLAAEVTPHVAQSLARRTVRVATRGLVQAIRALAAPTTWRDVSILARRRPLFFGAEPVRIAGFALDLDPELGLVIRKIGKETTDAVPVDP